MHTCISLFQLYLLADGQCIYRGPMGSLLPYLKSINLECPLYNNPADYSKCWLGRDLVVNPFNSFNPADQKHIPLQTV